MANTWWVYLVQVAPENLVTGIKATIHSSMASSQYFTYSVSVLNELSKQQRGVDVAEPDQFDDVDWLDSDNFVRGEVQSIL